MVCQGPGDDDKRFRGCQPITRLARDVDDRAAPQPRSSSRARASGCGKDRSALNRYSG
jgi:hypothetical protein